MTILIFLKNRFGEFQKLTKKWKLKILRGIRIRIKRSFWSQKLPYSLPNPLGKYIPTFTFHMYNWLWFFKICSKILIFEHVLIWNRRACRFFQKTSRTDFIFSGKITSGMLQFDYMKIKKISHELHALYQIRRALWNPLEKSAF